MATIFIENLRVDTVIGICDWELTTEQPLFFDIEMDADIGVFSNSDSIDHALDYAVIAEQVAIWVKQDNNKLLESMIVGLVDYLLAVHAAIIEITVTVRKPRAIEEADAAGIRYKKVRASVV